MAQSVRLTLTESTIAGLFFIQRYRFLTIDQFARAGGLHHSTASEQLRQFQRLGVLGFFGNTRLPGNGKTPKAYFLTRKGFDLLREESGIPPELLGGHKEVKVEAAWSPVMYHRLRTVDLLITLEVAVRKRAHLALVQTFLEYRRVKRGNHIVHETMDFVDSPESAENKIIPDAAFILENVQTKKRALFFLEMDMATERRAEACLVDLKDRHQPLQLPAKSQQSRRSIIDKAPALQTCVAGANRIMTADLHWDGALFSTDDGDVSCSYALYSYY